MIVIELSSTGFSLNHDNNEGHNGNNNSLTQWVSICLLSFGALISLRKRRGRSNFATKRKVYYLVFIHSPYTVYAQGRAIMVTLLDRERERERGNVIIPDIDRSIRVGTEILIGRMAHDKYFLARPLVARIPFSFRVSLTLSDFFFFLLLS